LWDIGPTVLKFTWDARTINFSKFEVNTVEITTNKKLDLQRLQNRQPIIYELGENYKIIHIILDPDKSPTTMTKLQSLQRVSDIVTMTLYYSDGVTQAEQFNVRVDPGDKAYYLGGNMDAGTPMGMTFFEAEAG